MNFKLFFVKDFDFSNLEKYPNWDWEIHQGFFANKSDRKLGESSFLIISAFYINKTVYSRGQYPTKKVV